MSLQLDDMPNIHPTPTVHVACPSATSPMTNRFLSHRAGTPLLVGPEGNEAGDGSEISPPSAPDEEEAQPDDIPSPEPTPAKSAPSETEKKPEHTASTSADKPTDTPETSNGATAATADPATITESPTSLMTTASSAASTGSSQRTITSGPPKIQLTSLAYLVPIFLLVAITVGAIIYRKCRPRKRSLHVTGGDEYAKSPEIPEPQGWREVPTSEEEAGKDPIWSPRTDREGDEEVAAEAWRNVRLQESKSRPGLMDVSYGSGRGWFNSARWNLARSPRIDPCGSTDQLDSTAGAGGRTMRLVLPRSGPTYMSLLPSAFASRRGQAGVADDGAGEKGVESKFASGRSWKAFSSFALRLTPSKKQLERNKSPNKRRSIHPTAALPDAPNWIQPRATSPDRQILSPPLQPHLFFHPPPPMSMTTLRLPSVTNTESDGTYTDTETHLGSSVIDDRIRKTVATPSTPRKHRRDDPEVTPTKASLDVGDTTPVQRWRAGLTALPGTPSKTSGSRGSGYMVNGATGTISSASPRKSRKERKEQKARERVESILQASWSDRALSSPGTSTTDLSAQPGVQRTRASGQTRGGDGYGGIDARLADFRTNAP